jgi:hypothetical protein
LRGMTTRSLRMAGTNAMHPLERAG